MGADETIGNFGYVLGGAAGDELDRVDHALGSPPHTLLLASSSGHGRVTMPVIEDYPEISVITIPRAAVNVRADMAYLETGNNGAVFSASAISWCGSLAWNDYDNNVSRITENVVRRFMRDA